MTTAAPTAPTAPAWTDTAPLWRCLRCGGDSAPLADGSAVACPRCGASSPIRDGVVVARESVDANNRVASDFYNSPEWPRFRFWEWVTFLCNGGEKRSRDKVLRHLPNQPGLRLLDVAIGDGVYLDWLPRDWSVVGIDVSTAQLDACRKRGGGRDLKLILGEAEDLPVRDGSFDAALSIGGFNYFNDPEKSLREMARAVRPGGAIVVSDELPNLTDRMWFRKIGLPKVDHWFLSKFAHLGDPFTEMVERYRDLDVEGIARRVLPGCHYERIWMGVGYVFVGRAPG